MSERRFPRRELLQAAGAAALSAGSFAAAPSVRAESAGPDVKTPAGEVEPINGRWTAERIKRWYDAQPWIVGCNYVPTYAINQIEMWQKLTFNPEMIDSELALAESIGFNTIRVFAHDLVWSSERESYFANIGQFLDICEKHGLRVIFNFFTNGGREPSVMGPQPEPIPDWHNGQWRQTPGVEKVMNRPERWNSVEGYVKETIEKFADDKRILFWDIFNEPANIKVNDITGFVRLAFSWARSVNPPQPMTSAFLRCDLTPLNAFLAENSDLLSFHCYRPKEEFEKVIQTLQKFNRPIVCKEWLARPLGCTVEDCLPLMKENRVGAVNWGLIPGKLQTNLPWKNVLDKHPEYRKTWLHDLFDENHRPYSESEIELIKKLTGKK